MAATISERFQSRDGTAGPTPEGIRRYVITGTDDETVAQTLGASYAPATWGNLYRGDMRYSHQGGGVWHVEAQYGPRNRQSGESEWSFSIQTKQTHITHSLETIESYVAAGEAETDYKQAINVVGDGGEERIEGVDIPVAELTWQETLYLPIASFTSSYLNVLKAAVGKTNDAAFRIWGEQEVMLQGVSGRPAGDLVELTFQFASEESKTGITIGTIANIAKKGWEYLWVASRDIHDADGERIRPQPQQVNVEKVIETYDYTLLGIPDPFS